LPEEHKFSSKFGQSEAFYYGPKCEDPKNLDEGITGGKISFNLI